MQPQYTEHVASTLSIQLHFSKHSYTAKRFMIPNIMVSERCVQCLLNTLDNFQVKHMKLSIMQHRIFMYIITVHVPISLTGVDN